MEPQRQVCLPYGASRTSESFVFVVVASCLGVRVRGSIIELQASSTHLEEVAEDPLPGLSHISKSVG